MTVVGDAFIDIVVPVYGIKKGETYHRKITTICGGTANVAVWISRLGGRVKFVGKVGNDVFGNYFRQKLREEGVKDLLFVDARNPTGLCISLTFENGERTMIANRGANDYLAKEEIERCLDEIVNSKLVYFSGYSFMSEETKQAILYTTESCKGKCEIWFNPGAPNIIQESFRDYIRRFVDVLILNFYEARAMTKKLKVDEVLKDLEELASLVVVTMGKNGCIVSSNGDYVLVPTRELNIEDTTGAGDVFSAGFIAGKLRGLDDLECAKLGNETALKFLKEKSGLR